MKGQRADTFLHHHGLQDAFSKNISFDDPQNGIIFHVENRSRMKGPPQSDGNVSGDRIQEIPTPKSRCLNMQGFW